MTSPRVLLLGCASPTPHGRDQMRRLSRQARRRGVHLIGADTPENLRLAPTDLVDEVIELPVHDVAACRLWAATRPRLDAVLTYREMCVEPVAAISDELGIAGNDPQSAYLIRHKDLARTRLREAGLAQPATLLTDDPRQTVAFMAQTGTGPWIVKPRAGMGSAGVSLVKHVDDLPAAMAALGGEIPFLVETYVSGREYSAEGLMIGSVPYPLAITEKFTNAGFVETGHRVPADLDEATSQQARESVERALVAAGITRGIFHVEFWVTGDGVVLGELHARPGGDFIHALVEQSRPGLELYGTLIDDLLGNGCARIPDQTAAGGADYLFLPPGRVRSVHGWDEVLRDPAVIGANLSIKPGDRIEAVTSSSNRHGVIAVTGADREQVDGKLADLARVLRVDVEP